MDRSTLKIVCWLWQERMFTRPKPTYTKKHIEVWRDMINRHLDMPHEFICFTDQPDKVPQGVRYEPIPDETLLQYGGCFVRLQEFSPEVGEIIGGKFVDIDLDCVVTNQLDDLFQSTRPLKVMKVCDKRAGRRIQGSMWMAEPGSFPELWRDFRTQDFIWYKRNKRVHQWINKYAYDAGYRLGTDQSWLNYKISQLSNRSREIDQWTENDGVVTWGSQIKRMPHSSPDLARTKIVFFPGASDPMKLKENSPWIREYYHQ